MKYGWELVLVEQNDLLMRRLYAFSVLAFIKKSCSADIHLENVCLTKVKFKVTAFDWNSGSVSIANGIQF